MSTTVANIELRGYEVARETPRGWTQVMAFCASEYGRVQAVASANWLQDRWPKEQYRARAIVSLEPQATSEELHLTEDEPELPPERPVLHKDMGPGWELP